MVKIDRYGSNGEGIALCDGKVVFVPYSLQGEEVELEITKDTKHFSVANLKDIAKASSKRIEPVCPWFKKCGGCQIMHASYDEQLVIKHQIVKNNLAKFAGYDGEINKVYPSHNINNYRNHMTFAVSKNGKLGFFIQGKHDVLEIKKCYLADENINKCIDIFNSYFFDNNISGYDYETKQGTVKQVDIKFQNNQLLITVVATQEDLPNLEHLAIRLNLLRLKYGVYVSLNNSANTMIYGKLKHLMGIEYIATSECQISSLVSPFSFLQVNNEVKEQIYQDITKNISGGIVVDAYAGRGVLSALVSKTAHTVYAIEISESSVSDGLNLLSANDIKNVKYICGDVKESLDYIDEKIDCIILDPPRKGVDKIVLENIIQKQPQRIIYLSCSSDTLARDLKFLMYNYSVTMVQPYDMFPNTSNIETLVIMEKK